MEEKKEEEEEEEEETEEEKENEEEENPEPAMSQGRMPHQKPAPPHLDLEFLTL